MKTKATGASVPAFLAAIPDDAKRADAKALAKLMQRVTGAKAKMWGDAIVGYGETTITYASGKETPWLAVAFSPRAASLTVYVSGLDRMGALLKKLGPHKVTKACLYIKRLEDVNAEVLEEIVKRGYAFTSKE